MSEKIVTLNEEVIKGQLKELVRGSVGETLNELLEQEAEKLTQAARYERNEARQGYRSGHYDRNLTTTSGDVTLHVPRLKGISFETAIIERYRRRESSVEEALMEMYLAGVSVRRVEGKLTDEVEDQRAVRLCRKSKRHFLSSLRWFMSFNLGRMKSLSFVPIFILKKHYHINIFRSVTLSYQQVCPNNEYNYL